MTSRSGDSQQLGLRARQIYGHSLPDEWILIDSLRKKKKSWSGQQFCSTSEGRLLFFFLSFFFMAPERLCRAEDRSNGRWFAAPAEWKSWGALIRQPPTQRAGTLITLRGVVWQQAWWLGTSRHGNMPAAHFSLLPFEMHKLCSGLALYNSSWFSAQQKPAWQGFFKVG